MSYEPYSLEIISQHPDSKGRNIRKYAVDGTPTVGAFGNEPFEIVFKNNTGSKVQLKLSVDGTDVLTGLPADTELSKDMWVVGAYQSMSLKAWPETTNGGAAFVFTDASNGVGLHVHGDVSSRGIIAAAVYKENYKPPTYRRKAIIGGRGYNEGLTKGSGGWNGTLGDMTFGCDSNSFDSLSFNDCSDERKISDGILRSEAAVGAGSYVEQKISYVSGLIEPKFAEVVKVKYVWWEDLVNTLKKMGQNPYPVGTGFPGDEKKLMSIGSTPRLGAPPPEPQPVTYSRF